VTGSGCSVQRKVTKVLRNLLLHSSTKYFVLIFKSVKVDYSKSKSSSLDHYGMVFSSIASNEGLINHNWTLKGSVKDKCPPTEVSTQLSFIVLARLANIDKPARFNIKEF